MDELDELDPAVDRAALEAYSRSMPGAVPSKDLALAELADRNGMFLRSGRPQPTHERLLREVGVDPVEVMTTAPAPSQRWRHAASGFGFRARRAARAAPRSAVVVGAGVMGSAVALELATRGVAVTVLDGAPRAGDGVARRRRLRGRDLGLVGVAQRERQGREESGVWWPDAHQPRHVAPAGAVRRPRDLVRAPCCTPTASRRPPAAPTPSTC